MQQKRRLAKIMAVLLAAMVTLAVAAAPIAVAAIEETPPYLEDETYDYVADYPAYQPYEDMWQLQVTGSFYGLHLVSIENGITTAIISQCGACSGLLAVSTNLMDWEIIGPATEIDMYNKELAYISEIDMYTRETRYTLETDMYTEEMSYPPETDMYTEEIQYPPEDDMYDEKISYPPETDIYPIAPPLITLGEAGIIRIERLPYQIHDRIIWVGFAILGNADSSTRREQIRIYMNDIWLNPLPYEAETALIGLEGFGWGREAIEFVVARNLMDMYNCPETHEPIAFNPAEIATRGDMLAAAVMALGLTPPYNPESNHVPFYDVPLYGRGIYIDIAKQLGLVVGIGNNHFVPDGAITRQDMMTMFYNILLALGQIQPDTNLTALGRFNDIGQIADYARLPISSLAMAGIITGDGISINPRRYMTRVEAAVFVRNLYRIGE